MRFIFPLLLVAILLRTDKVYSQLSKDEIKEYLGTGKFAIDSDAGAVVLYERTNIEISLEDHEFRETRQFYKTIKILKVEGIRAANVKVTIPKENYANYVYKIHGKTFNLSGNEVDVSELPYKAIAETKGENMYEVTFTLPDVKVGSIIEYSYSISSPFYYQFPEWEIEGAYPKLATEYYLSYPAIVTCAWNMHMNYKMVAYTNKKKALASNDMFSQFSKSSATATDYNYYLWIRRNVIAQNHEPQVSKDNKTPESMELKVVRVNNEDVGK